MPDLERVASVSGVPPGEMIVVEVGGEEVAIANVAGEFCAFSNTCTHRGGPLSDGLLAGDIVECPFHGGQFNVRTGEAVSPPATEAVKTYPVQVAGDDIRVATT